MGVRDRWRLSYNMVLSQEAEGQLEGERESLRLIAINCVIDLLCHYVFSKYGWDSPKEIRCQKPGAQQAQGH